MIRSMWFAIIVSTASLVMMLSSCGSDGSALYQFRADCAEEGGRYIEVASVASCLVDGVVVAKMNII